MSYTSPFVRAGGSRIPIPDGSTGDLTVSQISPQETSFGLIPSGVRRPVSGPATTTIHGSDLRQSMSACSPMPCVFSIIGALVSVIGALFSSLELAGIGAGTSTVVGIAAVAATAG